MFYEVYGTSLLRQQRGYVASKHWSCQVRAYVKQECQYESVRKKTSTSEVTRYFRVHTNIATDTHGSTNCGCRDWRETHNPEDLTPGIKFSLNMATIHESERRNTCNCVFKDVVNCLDYTVSVTEKWTSVEHWSDCTDRGKPKYSGKEPAQVPLRPPQIQHGLAWDQMPVSAATDRQVTAWATAQPTYVRVAW